MCICMYVCLCGIYVYMYVCVSTYLSIHPSVCLSMYIYICICVCLSVIRLSIDPSVYLSFRNIFEESDIIAKFRIWDQNTGKIWYGPTVAAPCSAQTVGTHGTKEGPKRPHKQKDPTF